MIFTDAPRPDWRDAAAYAPLLRVERAGFAWEWLRRDPGYRKAAAAAPGGVAACAGRVLPTDLGAARWGLHAFENPQLGVPHARPVWRADQHAFVLAAAAETVEAGEDSFILEQLLDLAFLLRSENGAEHLLMSDGLLSVRLDIISGSLSASPVRLHYRLSGLTAAKAPLLVLRRFLGVCRTGSFPRQLFGSEGRTTRLVLALRATDALAAGASQREIAEALFSAEAGNSRWRVNIPSARSSAQRLARLARTMSAGGYRKLLEAAPTLL